MQYIPIEKTELPTEFEIDFGEDTYLMKFAYSEVGDFFSASIAKESDEAEATPLVRGEKMVINRPLFADVTNIDMPSVNLIPMDLSYLEQRITWENFGETIFLYVADDEGAIDDN